MTLQSGEDTIDAIALGRGFMVSLLHKGDKIDVLANIQKNEWNGNVNVQLNIVDINY